MSTRPSQPISGSFDRSTRCIRRLAPMHLWFTFALLACGESPTAFLGTWRFAVEADPVELCSGTGWDQREHWQLGGDVFDLHLDGFTFELSRTELLFGEPVRFDVDGHLLPGQAAEVSVPAKLSHTLTLAHGELGVGDDAMQLVVQGHEALQSWGVDYQCDFLLETVAVPVE